MINQLRDEVHANARDKGFWDSADPYVQGYLTGMLLGTVCPAATKCELERKNLSPNDVQGVRENELYDLMTSNLLFGVYENEVDEKLSKLMLIVTEVVEAVQAVGNMNGVDNLDEEIADIIIRCLDFCGGYGIDIEKAINDKMNRNATRPHMHGKRA